MPNTLTMGPARMNPAMASGTEMITLHSSDWRARSFARAKLRPPTDCATSTDAPIDSAASAASRNCMICTAAPTPASAIAL